MGACLLEALEAIPVGHGQAFLVPLEAMMEAWEAIPRGAHRTIPQLCGNSDDDGSDARRRFRKDHKRHLSPIP